MPSFPAGPRGDMHDMAQPFFVWARHDRFPIARGYLFGSDPHECFVDNFLTWAEPVRFHPKPKPVRKPAAKKPARRKLPTRKPAARTRAAALMASALRVLRPQQPQRASPAASSRTC